MLSANQSLATPTARTPLAAQLLALAKCVAQITIVLDERQDAQAVSEVCKQALEIAGLMKMLAGGIATVEQTVAQVTETLATATAIESGDGRIVLSIPAAAHVAARDIHQALNPVH